VGCVRLAEREVNHSDYSCPRRASPRFTRSTFTPPAS
jgi:hypothetical protein